MITTYCQLSSMCGPNASITPRYGDLSSWERARFKHAMPRMLCRRGASAIAEGKRREELIASPAAPNEPSDCAPR